MNKLLLVIIASGFLLSCVETKSHITAANADTNTVQTSTKNVAYTCSRDTHLSVNFISSNEQNDKDIAIINGFGKHPIILPSRVVDSGFFYSNGKYSLRGQKQQATWTVGRMASFQCSVGDNLNIQEDLM